MIEERIKVRATTNGQVIEVVVYSKRADRIEVVDRLGRAQRALRARCRRGPARPTPATQWDASSSTSAAARTSRPTSPAPRGTTSGAEARVPRLVGIRRLDVDRASSPGRRRHIAAASGLVQVNDRLYVVADDELHLGVFERRRDAVRARSCASVAGDAAVEEEAGASAPSPTSRRWSRCRRSVRFVFGALLALGSGSRRRRRFGALIRLDASGDVVPPARAVDLTPVVPRAGVAASPSSTSKARSSTARRCRCSSAATRSIRRTRSIRIALAPILDALARRRRLPPPAIEAHHAFSAGHDPRHAAVLHRWRRAAGRRVRLLGRRRGDRRQRRRRRLPRLRRIGIADARRSRARALAARCPAQGRRRERALRRWASRDARVHRCGRRARRGTVLRARLRFAGRDGGVPRRQSGCTCCRRPSCSARGRLGVLHADGVAARAVPRSPTSSCATSRSSTRRSSRRRSSCSLRRGCASRTSPACLWRRPGSPGRSRCTSLAGACWLPVLVLQYRMREMARVAVDEDLAAAGVYRRYLRLWIALGIVAFGALLVVLWLMVARPT